MRISLKDLAKNFFIRKEPGYFICIYCNNVFRSTPLNLSNLKTHLPGHHFNSLKEYCDERGIELKVKELKRVKYPLTKGYMIDFFVKNICLSTLPISIYESDFLINFTKHLNPEIKLPC